MSAATAQAGVAFGALRHPAYRPYFITSMLSMMGDNVEHVITYWVIFATFHSPSLAGFAVVSHWAPFLLFAVWFGQLADRYDCRRIVQLAQGAFMIVSLAWATLFLTGRLETWHAMALLVAHGFAGALWAPASQLIIHDVVGSDHLQSGIRLNATARQLGILFGPAVGGALLLFMGPAYGLMANSLLYLPLTVWLLRVPYTGHVRESADLTSPRLTLADALQTFREVSGNRAIVVMIALAGLTSLFVGNAFQAQMPEFASGFSANQGEISYAVLLTANAAGAVVGGFALETSAFFRRPRVRTAVALGIFWSLAIIIFALAASYLLALVALFIAGVLNLAFSSMAQTLVQLEAPPNRRGRVVGLFNMSQNGLRVGSGVTVGVLGAMIGVHWSLALSAASLLAVSLLLLAFADAPRRALAAQRG